MSSTDKDSTKTSAVSFKLQSSRQKPRAGQDPVHKDQSKKDYLLSVEGNALKSVIPAPAAKEFIIPLIKQNQWRLPVKESKSGTSDKTSLAKDDQEAADAILKDIKTSKFTGTGEEDGGSGSGPVIPLLMQNKPPVETADEKLTDLSIRPNESTIGDYDEMPIDHFGAAMLKGMGWKPGEAIGLNKKGLLEPIEYIAHPGGLGLGATMKAPPPSDMKNKRKNKIKKPGEVEKKKAMPYVDKDGRVKHIKKIGEVIPEQIPEGYYPGNYGKVTIGPHTGLCGKIVSVDKRTSCVTLRMVINKEDMTFRQSHVDLISKSLATEAPPPSSQDSSRREPKQYGLILQGNKNRHEQSSSSSTPSSDRSRVDPPDSSTHMDTKRHIKREEFPYKAKEEHRTESNGEGGKDIYRSRTGRQLNSTESDIAEARRTDTRSREEVSATYYRQTSNLQDMNRDKAVDRQSTKRKEIKKEDDREGSSSGVKRSSSSSAIKSKETKKPKMEDCWLRAQLRVRMIDQKFKKGRYYNKKAVIVDIVDPTTCICQTDDGKLLEGVRLDMVETMVPKQQDAVVMVLKGEAKGQLATLLRRDNSRYIATIQCIESKEVMEIEYDNICEFIGETHYD